MLFIMRSSAAVNKVGAVTRAGPAAAFIFAIMLITAAAVIEPVIAADSITTISIVRQLTIICSIMLTVPYPTLFTVSPPAFEIQC